MKNGFLQTGNSWVKYSHPMEHLGSHFAADFVVFFSTEASSCLDGLANDALVPQVEEAKFRVIAGETTRNRNPKNPPRYVCVCVWDLVVGFFFHAKNWSRRKRQPKIAKKTWFRGGKLGVDKSPFLSVLRGVLFLSVWFCCTAKMCPLDRIIKPGFVNAYKSCAIYIESFKVTFSVNFGVDYHLATCFHVCFILEAFKRSNLLEVVVLS